MAQQRPGEFGVFFCRCFVSNLKSTRLSDFGFSLLTSSHVVNLQRVLSQLDRLERCRVLFGLVLPGKHDNLTLRLNKTTEPGSP